MSLSLSLTIKHLSQAPQSQISARYGRLGYFLHLSIQKWVIGHETKFPNNFSMKHVLYLSFCPEDGGRGCRKSDPLLCCSWLWIGEGLLTSSNFCFAAFSTHIEHCLVPSTIRIEYIVSCNSSYYIICLKCYNYKLSPLTISTIAQLKFCHLHQSPSL